MNDNMKHQDEIAVNDGSTALTIISWLFGLAFFAIGFVNTFWGNDPGFGAFITLLSLFYFIPVNAVLQKIPRISISGIRILKVLIGMFIIWAAMGVGDLPDKVELMVNDLQHS